MTIKQRIDKFIKKYPEPHQFRITLTWKRKDGSYSMEYFPENSFKANNWRSEYGFKTNTGRNFIAQHYRYDEKLGLLEIAYAVFDCHVPKDGENRRWTYGYRYFIPKDTRELYDVHGNQGLYTYVRATYTQSTYDKSDFARNFTSMRFSREMFVKEFLAFAGNNLQTASSWHTHITSDSYPWVLQPWFEYKPKTKTTGKMQKLIDELTAEKLTLPLDALYKIHEQMNSDNYNKKCAWFDLDHKVFRCYVKTNGGIFEDKRVYLADKGKVVVATINPQGEWVTNRSFTKYHFNFIIVNLDDVYKMPHYDYIKMLAKDKTPNVYKLVSSVKHPEIEQLANMGLKNIAEIWYRADSFSQISKDMFGVPNKKKSVLAKYNITKKQAEYVNRLCEEETVKSGCYWNTGNKRYGVQLMKKYMQVDNVASLDFDTFSKYYKFVTSLDWSQKRCIEGIPKEVRQKVVSKLCNMYEKHDTVITLLSDTINAYNYINRENRPNVDIYAIKSYEELVRLHDTCIELQRIKREEQQRMYNIQEAERRALLEKKMEKLDEERRKLNYSDDNFTIRLPEKLSEIVNEGSMLRHCVAGYTDRHAQGNTTIMFLRRNNDPTTSFYTIEIRNDNTIQQIHGFGNKWLGNNPEAIPTVMRWLRANHISCSDRILLSTAKGYSCGNAPLVEKPII